MVIVPVLRFGWGLGMEQGVGNQPPSYRGNTTILHTLHWIPTSIPKRQNRIPRIGDIWIPRLCVSPNHFVKLYIPGVENLFQIGDQVVKMEHLGSRSHILNWRIWWDAKQKLQYQLKSTNEQTFSTLPSDIIPLRPVMKEDQSEFLT
jgi:hypothetical protein